jgi:hypothetical protein
MPAHRKTRAQHEASGAVAKNPQRFREDTHVPPTPKRALNRAPKHLTAEEKRVWKELIEAAPDGVLGTCDAVLVEIAVKLTIQMRTGKMYKTSEMAHLAKIMGQLGMAPLDRLRLNVTTPTDPALVGGGGHDPLDELD